MKANCWMGKKEVRVENVPDPKILNTRDAIVRVTSTAICGSDLHLYNGFIPTMEKGDILGHEFMGEVVEVGTRRQEPQGRRPRRRAVPDRLRQLLRRASTELYSLLRELEPERLDGREAAGPLAARASSATRTCSAASPAARPSTRACRSPTSARSRSPTACRDEQVLFLSDIFPTGYMGAEMCDIKPGDVDRGLGLRPGRPVRDRERAPARRRARHRDRSLPVPAAAWRARRPARPTSSTTRRSTSTRRCTELTGGRGPDALHRRRRHGGARPRRRRTPTTAPSRR